MGRIENEYAEALLKYAREHEGVEKVLEAASRYSDQLKKDIPLSADEDEEDSGTLKSFMEHLAQRGRDKFAGEILNRFTELARAETGIINVQVISAAPLSEKQLMDLQVKLIQRSKKRIELSHKVDPTLIAGIQIIADGLIVDTSVKRELHDIREKFYMGVYFRG